MKFKVIKPFMPDVIVGQEIEIKGVRVGDEDFDQAEVKCGEHRIDIGSGYIKAHPEIFEPVIERWKPEKYGAYLYVENRGLIGYDKWEDHGIDKGRFEVGNMFKTRDQAKEASERIKKALLDYHEELN